MSMLINYTVELMVQDSLPHFCTNGHNIWQTISPLICFYIGEWHHPDRVLRQFDRVAHLVMRWHNRRRFTSTGPPIEQFDMDPDQLEEVDQHVEEVPPVTQTQTQSEHSYVSLVVMMPTFGTIYYDSGVGQSSYFGRRYYNSEVGPSSTDFGQQYYDLGSDPSSSYMHDHGRGRGEHNEYLYYEVPAAVPEQSDEQQQQENAAVPEQSDEQQQQENQEEIQQQRVQSRRRQPARNRRRPGCGTH
ncbi:GATA zinc finger domain-containing protein 10-like isoform X2 [Cucumis melo var. makuwa]|uniref:GATA zinc finger domain-containing protein 10-like isoform X2 n=1 Tax=Cucumis melo var. makuwa TaxID=1194695 RepID=A0A5D3BX46_CUCMM|nr:GATA zinc finger domain-containing protein 10-like isoform X2 [Cucumis melo var. makuwa]